MRERDNNLEKILKEIAEIVGGEFVGSENIKIKDVASIEYAGEGDITFLEHRNRVSLVESTKASAIIVPLDVEDVSIPHLKCPHPRYSFAKVMALFHPPQEKRMKRILHKSSVMGKNTEIGENVAIGAYSIVGDNTKIGEDVVIYPQVYIGDNVIIEDSCVIHPNVSIYHDVEIGNRVIIHSGTVIGSDGFGYVEVDGEQKKIPQVGKVIIEDDVEIGANVTIDRATMGFTRIGKGAKVDNLVQIAHNVEIGENTVIAGMVGISGSVKIGRNVVLAGQVGVGDHVSVGDYVKAGGKSGISKDIPPNTIIWGIPAKPIDREMKMLASLRFLPQMSKVIHELEKKLKTLEEKED